MRDRFPLLALAALAFLAASTFVLGDTARRGTFAEAHSTYRSAPDGARALLLLAERAGVEVRRRHLDFAEIRPEVGGIALLGIDRLPEQDLERLLAFVDRGGRLLVAADLQRDGEPRGLAFFFDEHRSLLDALGIRREAVVSPEIDRDLEPATPFPAGRGVEVLDGRVSGYLGSDSPEVVPLLVDPHADGRAVALSIPRGRGNVVVLSAPDLATNRVLARADNARLMLQLLEQTTGGKVVEVDEFHHGFTGERSVASFGARYGLHWAAAQLLVAVWLWVAASRRFGRARQAPREERASGADYLLAMARIYRQGGHRDHAARLLVEGLASALAPRAGMPPHAPPAQIAAGLDRRGRADLAKGLRSAASRAASARESEAGLLALARTCAAVRRLADRRDSTSAPANPSSTRSTA